MLTGLQIRRARMLLGWRRLRFGRHVLVTEGFVTAMGGGNGQAGADR